MNIFSGIWGYIIAAGAGVALLLGVRQSGKNSAENDYMKNTLDAVERKDRVESDIDKLGSDDVTKQLRDNGWLRK